MKTPATNNLERENQLFITFSRFLKQVQQDLGSSSNGIACPRLALSIQHLRIDRRDRSDGLTSWTTTYRGIANDLIAAVEIRCDVGEHPIIAAILGHVLHIAEELLASLNRIPGQFECRARHVGMTHDVVLRTEQFGFAIAGKLDENRVPVRNDALGVGFRDDEIILPHHPLHRGRFNLALHLAPLLLQPQTSKMTKLAITLAQKEVSAAAGAPAAPAAR